FLPGGGLRFSERVLINQTRYPATAARPGLEYDPTWPYRFRDETLGADGLFGGNDDRMPPLKPEWITSPQPQPWPEIDHSNTQDVKFGMPFATGGVAPSIHVYDKRNH